MHPDRRDIIFSQTMHAQAGSSSFPTTRWTLVAAAGSRQPDGRVALAFLCEAYWYPLYAYARRCGHSSDQARDHTQEFFAQFLESRNFDRANPERGRFRSFLLSCFKYYLRGEIDRTRALKRGGGLVPLPFEISNGEEMYRKELFHDETPERIFERRWARTLLDRVMDRLRGEFVKHDREDQFEKVKGCIAGEPEIAYAELARQLETTEGALKTAIHRLRKRYRELLRAEIADIVADPTDIDSELRSLIQALSTR